MSRYKKRITPLVSLSILEARKWYKKEAPNIVPEFNLRLREAVAAVTENPLGYSVRFADIRRVNLDQFPYAFYFILDEEAKIVEFIRFFHIKMNVPYSDTGEPTIVIHEP